MQPQELEKTGRVTGRMDTVADLYFQETRGEQLPPDQQIALAHTWYTGQQAYKQLQSLESTGQRMSPGEWASLNQLIREGEKAGDILITTNQAWVVSIASKAAHGTGIDLLDVVQEVNVAMLEALTGFDPRKGKNFLTYVTYQMKLAAQIAKGSLRPGKESTFQQGRLFVEGKPTLVAASFLDDPIPGHEDDLNDERLTFLDLLEDPDDGRNFDDYVIEADRLAALGKLLDRLDDTERKVIELKFGIGVDRPLTFQQIASRLKIPEADVRRIRAIAWKKLTDSKDRVTSDDEEPQKKEKVRFRNFPTEVTLSRPDKKIQAALIQIMSSFEDIEGLVRKKAAAELQKAQRRSERPNRISQEDGYRIAKGVFNLRRSLVFTSAITTRFIERSNNEEMRVQKISEDALIAGTVRICLWEVISAIVENWERSKLEHRSLAHVRTKRYAEWIIGSMLAEAAQMSDDKFEIHFTQPRLRNPSLRYLAALYAQRDLRPNYNRRDQHKEEGTELQEVCRDFANAIHAVRYEAKKAKPHEPMLTQHQKDPDSDRASKSPRPPTEEDLYHPETITALTIATIPQAARLAGLHISTIYEWIGKNLLPLKHAVVINDEKPSHTGEDNGGKFPPLSASIKPVVILDDVYRLASGKRANLSKIYAEQRFGEIHQIQVWDEVLALSDRFADSFTVKDKNVINFYKTTIKAFYAWLGLNRQYKGRPFNPTAVEPEDILDYINQHIAEGREVLANYRRKTLSQFFSWTVSMGIIPKNPCL